MTQEIKNPLIYDSIRSLRRQPPEGIRELHIELLTQMYQVGVFKDQDIFDAFLSHLSEYSREQLLADKLVKMYCEILGMHAPYLDQVVQAIPEPVAPVTPQIEAAPNSEKPGVDLSKEKLIDALSFYAEFSANHPDIIQYFDIVGIDPTKEMCPATNIYTHEIMMKNGEPEDFRNIGEHLLAVAKFTKILGILLRLSAEDQDWAEEQALSHDISKIYEAMRKAAIKMLQKMAQERGINLKDLIRDEYPALLNENYSELAYLGLDNDLQKSGIDLTSQQREYLVNAGKETGHRSFKDFVVLDEKDEPILNPHLTWATKLVHHADDSIHTSKPAAGEKAESYVLTIRERMAASNFPKEYPFMYVEGIGFDKTTKKVIEWKNVDEAKKDSNIIHLKTYAEWQVWIADKIAAELMAQIMPGETFDDPGQKLKELVNVFMVT